MNPLVSPWKLKTDEAQALDALVACSADHTAAAAQVGVSVMIFQLRIQRAREQFRMNGAFIPSELTESALARLWAAWRKRPWTDTLEA